MLRRTFVRSAGSALLLPLAPRLALARHGRGASALSFDPYALRPPQGGDFFLDTTQGSDGTGSFASPWNHITSARLQTPVAGQSIWVRNGGGLSSWPDTRSLNSGTALNPIQLAVYPGDPSPTFNCATPGGVVFGGGDYWYQKGFTLTCVDTFWVLGNSTGSGAAAPCNNWRFIDFIGSRSDSAGATTDNSGVLKCDGNNDFLQVIRGQWSGPPKSNNQACLWFDTVPHVDVIGALIKGSASPVYFKHNNGNTNAGSFRNNIVRNAGRDMEAQRSSVNYFNNVFDATQLSIDASGGGALAALLILNHNTFLAGSGALVSNSQSASNTNNVNTNNVFAGAKYNENAFASGILGDTFDYDCFNGTAFQNNHNPVSLSTFQSTFSQEAHGILGTISFVGGSGGGGDVPANWALTAGSAGHLGASDGTDCGVNAANLLTAN